MHVKFKELTIGQHTLTTNKSEPKKALTIKSYSQPPSRTPSIVVDEKVFINGHSPLLVTHKQSKDSKLQATRLWLCVNGPLLAKYLLSGPSTFIIILELPRPFQIPTLSSHFYSFR
jgi:hypothetical protein